MKHGFIKQSSLRKDEILRREKSYYLAQCLKWGPAFGSVRFLFRFPGGKGVGVVYVGEFGSRRFRSRNKCKNNNSQKSCYGIEFSVEGNVPFKYEGEGNSASTLIEDAVPNGEGEKTHLSVHRLNRERHQGLQRL